MLNHLFNCHGEWGVIATLIGGMPLMGLWIKTKIITYKERTYDKKKKRKQEPNG